MKLCTIAITGLIALGCTHGAPVVPPVPLSEGRLPRTILARPELLRETGHLIREGNVHILPAYRALIRSADSALRIGPFTVMQKSTVPPSGDKHDYLSLAPYWWPDSTKPNGLPYIQRDGQMNPQTRIDHDGLRFGAMTNAVEALALAYWFTGDERYPARAALLVRTWFIDPATRMNPNLRFAQAIPGVTEGRGIGILDLRAFPRLLDALRLMDASSSWTRNDADAFNSWCRTYLSWLLESSNGKEERGQRNNHGTLYDMQAASIALFLGDSTIARELLISSARQRVDSQIASNGSQPLELERTRPIHYSLFNLDAFTQLAEMGRHVGFDLWHYPGAKGDVIKALRFVALYADTSRKWIKPDIAPIAPDAISIAMRRAGTVLGDTAFTNVATRATGFPGDSREIIFYPGVPVTSLNNLDSLSAHGLSYSRSQLRIAASTLNPEAGFPRVTRKDGSWEQQSWTQWTSGFFAGTLWYMYQLDRSTDWRSLAQRWTLGIAPAADLTTTHDLGFMVFNSFGHGYLLTNDTSYRKVVEQASKSLVTRYNPNVGAIQSWDTYGGSDSRGDWKYPVIVDNLMNLEMLFRASRWGHPEWKRIAERHALTSARAHVRPDGSTAHVALFDPSTGKLERLVTWQGWSDSSVWARGQAWAIYGFTSAYGFTGNRTLLRAAERTADWFIEHLPADGVPYWDLSHPQLPYVERDASAAAIAASALLDLSKRSSSTNNARYREAAERILGTLSTQYLTEKSGMASILAHAVGGRPLNSEIDVGLVYGDYYFVEALLRQRGIYRP